MIQRFLIAAIMGFLVLSSQIATAAPPIDWSKVQRISSKSDLAIYIEKQKRAGENIIPVILTNGLVVPVSDFLTLCPSFVVNQSIESNNGEEMRVIYTLKDYPGTRVANAYLRGDTTWLNSEEKELYEVAVKIVNEAKQKNGYYNQEYHIFHAIRDRATYHTTNNMSNQPHYVTAYGALIDGKANCQGYTDAFYMLGRMMGWNVGRMSGGGHQWNTIEFGDGKVYCVDVTWMDSSLKYKNRSRQLSSYFYFNAPIEIMEVEHQWDRSSQPPNLQPSVDNRYAYYETSSNLRHLSSAEAGLKLLAQKIGNEKFQWFSVMTPYDERYDNFDKASPYFNNELNKTSYRGKYWLHVKRLGKYLFFTVDLWDT